MTKRKTADADMRGRVEREAIAWILRTPTKQWASMARVWSRWLPALSSTSQRRILVAMLKEGVKRGDPWPAEFVAHFARQATPHLAVSEQPRSRIHDREAFRKAAELRVRCPDMSSRELAKTVGVGPTTILQWLRMPEFARYEADVRFLTQHVDSGHEQHRRKLQEFGRWLGERIERSHNR